MDLREFQNLIEVQSLENIISIHLKNISEHQNRITMLTTRREEKEALLHSFETEYKLMTKTITDKEKELSSIEKKLEQSKSHLSSVTNETQMRALENEVNSLEPRALELQDAILELMESSEKLHLDIGEAKTFISGIKKSLEEIQKEVMNEVSKEQFEIENLKGRIENLLTLVTPVTFNMFKNVQRKYQFKNPLAFIDKDHCDKCYFTITKNVIAQVQRGNFLDLCPGCGRILTPDGARTTTKTI